MKISKARVGNERSISPIIATLFLILITIATAVVVYSYVIGFTGNAQSPVTAQSVMTIEDLCVSSQSSGCESNGYFVVVLNSGSSIISSGTFQLYFTDVSKQTDATSSCQISSPVAPGSTFTCPPGSGTLLPAALNSAPGDVISVEVVSPGGGEVVSSAKVAYSTTSYVPVTIVNSQTSPTVDDLQVLLNVDFQSYSSYLSLDAGNIRFYNSTNFVVNNELPAWLENYTGGTGEPNTATNSDIWLKLVGTIIPASSQVTVYMVFQPASTEFDGVYWGEAPQLSATYGEFDNGANVFLYYNAAPQSISGWTVVGTAGYTSSAPSGSYFKTQDAYYANSANGDYLYSQVTGLSTNEIITFWTYTTGLGNVYFLASSAGAGQMGRLDSRGGGDYSGLATTTKWTSWSAPSSGLDETTDKWYKYDIVINGATATSYIGSSTNNLGTLGTLANSLSATNDGNYLGLVGDALGASYISYWNGIVVRYLPPAGVAPTITFGSIY